MITLKISLILTTLTKENYDIYNYRDITVDYLNTITGTLDVSEFSNSSLRHNVNQVSSSMS